MSKSWQRRSSTAIYKVAELCARMVQITDDCLSTESFTREGEDARRLFRVTVRQMQIRADFSGDPLLIAVVYDSMERFKESLPVSFDR